MRFSKIILTLLVGAITPLSAQDGGAFDCLPVDTMAAERLIAHMRFLASNDLEGRAPGSSGTEMAANYIVQHMENLGLRPYGDDENWEQRFVMNIPVKVDENTYLRHKKFNPKLDKAFFATEFSSNGLVKARTRFVGNGIEAPENNHNDYSWRRKRLKKRIAVIDLDYPGAPNPFHPLAQYMDVKERVDKAVSYGAKGVILMNTKLTGPEPAKEYDFINDVGVPVVFLRNPILTRKVKKWWGKKVEINVSQSVRQVEEKNIIAYLDNHANFTIVLAAHYDHLGKGNRLSLAPGADQIHPGADANASGTALVLELAEQLSRSTERQSFNYLFVLFSGTETGQYGAKAFVDRLDFFEGEFACAINFDQVGRLGDMRDLYFEGVGSSRHFKAFYEDTDCHKIRVHANKKTPETGNHNVLYTKKIAGLKVTSGAHEDYRKPSDTYDRILFEGMAEIGALVQSYINTLPSQIKLEYDESFEPIDNKGGEFSRVKLGITPNYEHRRPGMKILLPEPDGPAQKAGLHAGDIITHINYNPLEDIYHYMDYVNLFKPGQRIFIKYERDGKKGAAMLQL